MKMLRTLPIKRTLSNLFTLLCVLMIVHYVTQYLKGGLLRWRTKLKRTYSNDHPKIIKKSLNDDSTLSLRPQYGCDIQSFNITWQNRIWQVLRYKDSVNNTIHIREIFAYKLYYDDRFGKQALKGFITYNGYLHANVSLKCQFWMDDSQVLTTAATVKIAGISIWKVNGIAYVPYLLTCIIPKQISISQIKTVSLLVKDRKITLSKTCLPIVIPNKPTNNYTLSNKSIGVCLKGLIYSMTDSKVAYFVVWMETLMLFEVKHVTIYNTHINMTSKFAKSMLNHYVQNGRLSVIDFPTIPTKYNSKSPYTVTSAAELIQSHTTGDCFYRNLYNYWYILHIDLDEIPVPRMHSTYQEFMSHYLSATPTASNAFSISMKSAFNYLYFQPSHPELPEYLQILRYNYRMPVDTPKGNSAGYMKSFINPRKCEIVWAHRCLIGNFNVVDEKYIFVNHYRDTCRLGKECKNEWNRRIKDVYLLENYGTIIQYNTEKVLKKVGFLK